MAKFNVNAECTMTTAAKAIAKAELMEVIEKALKAHYGEDGVKWVRSMGSSPKNEIGVIVGDISDSGFEYDLTFTVDTTCKPYKSGKRGKTAYEAFDMDEAHEAYEEYLTSKAEKKRVAEETKKRKIAEGESN